MSGVEKFAFDPTTGARIRLERKRVMSDGWHYAPIYGGWGYELKNGKYEQTNKYWFPVLCSHRKTNDLPFFKCDKCQKVDDTKEGSEQIKKDWSFWNVEYIKHM